MKKPPGLQGEEMTFNAERAYQVATWFAYKACPDYKDDITQEVVLMMWQRHPERSSPKLLTLKACERLFGRQRPRPTAEEPTSEPHWAETVDLLIDLERLGLTEAEESAILDKLRGERLGKNKNRLVCVKDRMRRRCGETKTKR